MTRIENNNLKLSDAVALLVFIVGLVSLVSAVLWALRKLWL